MPDQKYTNDPAVTVLTGAERWPIAQLGVDKYVTPAVMATYIGAATAGTANRISVVAGIIDIDAAYAGQASITTVGTVVAGTWSAKFTPRSTTTTSGATIAINADIQDIKFITALAVNTTISVVGTPVADQELRVRIKDNGSSHTLTWDAGSFTFIGVAAPSATIASQTMYLIFKYNAVISRWVCILNSDTTGGGTPSLTATYVGYGDGSNLLTGTSNFTFASNNLTITSTGRQIMLGGWVTLDTSYSALYFATPGPQNFALSGDNNVTFLNAPTSGTLYCQVGNTSALELRTARANFLQPVYIGGTTAPSAELHVVATTEQLRIGYDGSNYYSTTVANNGLVTFNAVGSGAMFLFTDTVNIGTGIYNDGGGMKHARVTTGSVTGAATALVTVTWTTAFPDANYTVQASVLDSTTSSLSLSVVHIESITASAITVRVINNAVGALTGTLHVIAIHD